MAFSIAGLGVGNAETAVCGCAEEWFETVAKLLGADSPTDGWLFRSAGVALACCPGSIKYFFRWNAYVGKLACVRSDRGRPSDESNFQSTGTPASHIWATAFNMLIHSRLSSAEFAKVGNAICVLGSVACCFESVASVLRGPSSIRIRDGSSSHIRVTASLNRTGFRKCSAQYRGSFACSSVSQSPVTVERMGIAGDDNSNCPIKSANGSTIESIMGE